VARVLTQVAEIASETLELQDVFARVANSIREVIPFDNMGVVRIVDGDRAVIHASTIPCSSKSVECSDPIPLTAWSPRMRPRPGPNRRIERSASSISFCGTRKPSPEASDRRWEPFAPRMPSGEASGSPYCTPPTEEHQEVLQLLAALLETRSSTGGSGT
jgi:hypothetical protein